MEILKVLPIVTLIVCSFSLSAQQPLEIKDLVSWKRIESEAINATGSHTTYVLQPDKGDPTTLLVDNATGQEEAFPRADNPQFSYDGQHLLVKLHPSEAKVREYKKRNKKEELKTMDSLLVIHIRTGERVIIPDVREVKMGEKWSEYFAYTTGSTLPDSLVKNLPE
ncbi:MAG: hypothetical protein AAFU67_12615, partial [Bacteroidota bacterium]